MNNAEKSLDGRKGEAKRYVWINIYEHYCDDELYDSEDEAKEFERDGFVKRVRIEL